MRELGATLGRCIDPEGGDPKRAVEFAAGENILNCRQHSRTRGYVSAQYFRRLDYARIGISDCGRGILESFRANGSPHYREGMNDGDALRLAIRPNVSSTTHLPHAYGRSPNRGVGLSMMRELVRQSFGYMILASGDSWWSQDGVKEPVVTELPGGLSFQGTVCSVAMRRMEIGDFYQMLQEARDALGLGLPGGGGDDRLFQ